MKVLAIDPGTVQSAFVEFDGGVRHSGIVDNSQMLCIISDTPGHERLALEMVESFGMPVGRETFETVFWIGRFYEMSCQRGIVPERLTRHVIKLHLCQSARAKDSNIRQALIDRFGGDAAIGKKATPGPLYGIKSHEWAALALAVTWWDRENF